MLAIVFNLKRSNFPRLTSLTSHRYYQTVKGMVTPLDILEPGGTLIITSDCSGGLGSKEFVEAQVRVCIIYCIFFESVY